MKHVFVFLESITNFFVDMVKLHFSLLELLYQNFSFPILILILAFIFRNEISEILSTHKIDKITRNSIELSQKLKKETNNKEEVILKEYQSILG
ncbi:hypothetical protein IDG46_25395, partial [Staphylococcus sp. EG-SA-13]|nr:hypothetical protein [Staphylococcus sp. EG-SA-13]